MRININEKHYYIFFLKGQVCVLSLVLYDLYINIYVVILYLNLISRKLDTRYVIQQFPRSNIIMPCMKRTLDDLPINSARRQRSVLMTTLSLHGIILAICIE